MTYSYTDWVKDLDADPSEAEMSELLEWLKVYPELPGARRIRIWEHLRRLDYPWTGRLLEKIAFECDGPPDSSAWVWLLAHPERSDAILKRATFLSSVGNGTYNHSGRFARVGLKGFIEDARVQAASIVATKILEEKIVVHQKDIDVLLERIYQDSGTLEVFTRLYSDGWQGSLEDLIKNAEELS